MPRRTSRTGSELFIVDNSDTDWKVVKYLHDWCQIAKYIDIATGYFEIGSLLALKDEWQKVDEIRILMGDEVSKRTKKAFLQGLQEITDRLDDSEDSPCQTHGCRHTNPNVCSNYHMENICAFVKADKICIKPPRSWAKQYEKLLKEKSQ